HRFFIIGIVYRAISTYSRGAFLAAGALGLMFVLRSKQKLRATVTMVVIGGVVLGALPQSFWERMGTIHVQEDKLEDDSARSRFHFWRVAVEMANDNAIIGVGYNCYTRFYDKYDTTNGQYGRRRAVHSMWFGV